MLNVVKSPYRTAYENLAFEQELLRTGTPFLFTHRDAPCVSVGFNQDIEAEVDAALAKELGVDIVRRQSGGGAVYRDEGCVAFSMAVPRDLLPRAMEVPERALMALGAPAVRNDRNDVYVAGRKVCGCAWQDAGDLVVFHGSVLFDVDLDAMNRLLAPGKRKYCGTAMRSVFARVRNIKDLVPQMTADKFQGALERALLASVSLGAM